MSLNYSHSNVMGIVKATKETISDNYSSSQYIEVLDTLLNNAIRPILRSTTFADVFISGVMHHYTENARRKISQVPKDKFLARGMLFLASDVYRKPKLYKKLRVERSVSAIVIKRFLSATADYEKYKRQYVLNPSP